MSQSTPSGHRFPIVVPAGKNIQSVSAVSAPQRNILRNLCKKGRRPLFEVFFGICFIQLFDDAQEPIVLRKRNSVLR